MSFDRAGTQGELVSFTGADRLWLDGILYSPSATNSRDSLIVHVHGSYGNFYANRWLRPMASRYMAAGYSFLSFNLSCHDGVAEGYRQLDQGSGFKYVGHAITDYETHIGDIGGAIEFGSEIASSIILQGHSLGCDRVLSYLQREGGNFPAVFLSPADTPQIMRDYYAPDSPRNALMDLKSEALEGVPFDWLPISACGVAERAGSSSEVYQIPITWSAAYAWLITGANGLIDLDRSASSVLGPSAFVYLGGQDGYQTESHEETFRFFEDRFESVQRSWSPEGDHELSGVLREVTDGVTQWADALI